MLVVVRKILGDKQLWDGDDINGLLTNNGVGGVIARGVFVDGRANVKPAKTIQNTWTRSWQTNEQYFNLQWHEVVSRSPILHKIISISLK